MLELGKVTNLVCTATAKNPQGEYRQLKIGDPVFDGDLIIAGAGGFVTVTTLDNFDLTVDDKKAVAMDKAIVDVPIDTSEFAVSEDTADFARTVINADLNQLEATAAGLSGAGGEDGGHTFTQLQRVLEDVVNSVYQYSFEPLSANHLLADPVETTLPETTVPETTVPETTVPETTIPETTLPETTIPETTLPETTLPETTVPETTIPETTVPETTVPETTVPETTLPETTVPETTVPETTVPETTPPETTPPETTPEETCPPDTTPDATCPPETTPEETCIPDTTPECIPDTTPDISEECKEDENSLKYKDLFDDEQEVHVSGASFDSIVQSFELNYSNPYQLLTPDPNIL